MTDVETPKACEFPYGKGRHPPSAEAYVWSRSYGESGTYGSETEIPFYRTRVFNRGDLDNSLLKGKSSVCEDANIS